MKKLALGIVIGVAVIFVGLFAHKAVTVSERPTWSDYFGTPEYTKVDTKKPLEEQTRRLQIAGRTFDIPMVYIGSQPDKGLVQKDGVILEYVLPDFKSKLEFPNRDAYKRAFKAGRFGQMLIEPEARRPSFDVMVKNLRRNLIKEEYIGVHDRLEYYRWYRGTVENPIHYYDMYLEQDDGGRIMSYIECSTMARGAHMRRTGCSHKFRDKHLLYYVSYNKDNYFPEWHEQRGKAIEFVDSFEAEVHTTTIKEDQ